jgi:hypothetical protein
MFCVCQQSHQLDRWDAEGRGEQEKVVQIMIQTADQMNISVGKSQSLLRVLPCNLTPNAQVSARRTLPWRPSPSGTAGASCFASP